MKVIIAGSRSITESVDLVNQAVKESGFEITEVVCGMARGADRAGMAWAADNGIPWHEMPADWKKYGKSAGPIRNAQMADYADALILLWDGLSPGSRNVLYCMEGRKPVFVKIIGEIKIDNPRMTAQVFGFE